MSEVFFSLVGRVALIIRYKNWEEARKVRDTKYGGHYSTAGRVYSLDAIALIGALLCIIFLLGMIGKLLFDFGRELLSLIP